MLLFLYVVRVESVVFFSNNPKLLPMRPLEICDEKLTKINFKLHKRVDIMKIPEDIIRDIDGKRQRDSIGAP